MCCDTGQDLNLHLLTSCRGSHPSYGPHRTTAQPPPTPPTRELQPCPPKKTQSSQQDSKSGWATRYDDGTVRPRLIGLFRGKRQVAVILRIEPDGAVFYNFMDTSKIGRLDDFRVGELLYSKMK